MITNQYVQLIPLAVVALYFWLIIDVLRNEFTGYNKIIWLIVVVFFPVFGVLLYLTIGKKQKNPQSKGG